MSRRAVILASRPAIRGTVVCVSLLLVLGACRAIRADDVAELVGSWKLVSYEDREVSGTPVYPYGRAPAGLLVYDATGHMGVQMMKTPPPDVASADRLVLSETWVQSGKPWSGVRVFERLK